MFGMFFFILPSFLLCNHYASCLELVGNFGFFGLRVFSLLVFKHRHFASTGHPSRSFLSLFRTKLSGIGSCFWKDSYSPCFHISKICLFRTDRDKYWKERWLDPDLLQTRTLQLQRFTLIARVKCGQAERRETVQCSSVTKDSCTYFSLFGRSSVESSFINDGCRLNRRRRCLPFMVSFSQTRCRLWIFNTSPLCSF